MYTKIRCTYRVCAQWTFLTVSIETSFLTLKILMYMFDEIKMCTTVLHDENILNSVELICFMPVLIWIVEFVQ